MNRKARSPALDDVDLTLLRLLQADGRMTNAALARAVGMTAPAILERVRRLEEAGVIRDYRARLDPARVGLGLTVLLAVTLEHHGERAVLDFAAAIDDVPEVVECHHTTGRADFMLKVVARDVEHYRRLVMHDLDELPGVERVESIVVLETTKDSGSVPLTEQ